MSNMTIIKTDRGEIKLSPQIIKQYLVRGNGDVNDQEVMMFLSLCKFQQLNPFLNEAYLVKFGNSQANIIVGKEAFTKRAFSDSRFQGIRAGIIVERNEQIIEIEGSFFHPKDNLIGGWAEVHVENRLPLKHSVAFAEYNKAQSSWKSMPATMIRKVALVQALREAFPDLFQAMYSPEEMPVDTNIVDKLEEVEMPKECIVEEEVFEVEEEVPEVVKESNEAK